MLCGFGHILADEALQGGEVDVVLAQERAGVETHEDGGILRDGGAIDVLLAFAAEETQEGDAHYEYDAAEGNDAILFHRSYKGL